MFWELRHEEEESGMGGGPCRRDRGGYTCIGRERCREEGGGGGRREERGGEGEGRERYFALGTLLNGFQVRSR